MKTRIYAGPAFKGLSRVLQESYIYIQLNNLHYKTNDNKIETIFVVDT